MSPKTFRCGSRGCIASYQRKEHLRRHEKQHRQQALRCIVCDHEFGRRDTLRRHMQKIHDISEPPQVKRACTHCRNQKIRCEGGNPCKECSRRTIDCSRSGQRESTDESPLTLRLDSPSLQTNHSAKGSRYLELYWELFHSHWPFIHRVSFSEHETPLLIQSMVVLGLWMSQEPNAEAKAIELHNLLGSALRDQADVWDAFKSGQTCNSLAWPLPTYQAILLHIIFAGVVKPCGALGIDLKPCLLPDDLDLLTRLVASCKKIGMFYYPNMLFGCSLHNVGPFNWVIVEEVKHFNLALFKVWKRFGKSSKHGIGIDSLQVAGSADWGLGPHDLQFPLPKNVELWNAKSKEEWLAVGAEKMEGPDLNDTLMSEWISNSAEVLEGIGI